MADIVLQDGTGESQTYENVETLEVDTPDGGTATFVSEDLIPEAYVHPATHPASMITGLATVAKGGEFADLRAKPFGDMPRLEECELSFPASEDGYSSVMIPGIWDVKPGDSYVITFDGTQYPCVCKRFINTVIYFGNTGMMQDIDIFSDAPDTGEPFLFWLSDNYSDDIEDETLVFSYFIIHGAAETHTISIIPTENVRKLDAKYLPDEAATQDFVKDAIAGIEVPGGSAVTETELPFFDLTAMGLPALPLDGTQVSVECDTSELYAALGKGVVKVSFTANVGTELTVSGIVNAMYMLGAYQCSFLGIFGTPMLLNFNVTTTAIDGCIKTLATT